jgi:hypothetical protein
MFYFYICHVVFLYHIHVYFRYTLMFMIFLDLNSCINIIDMNI